MQPDEEFEEEMAQDHPSDHFDPTLPENQIVVVGNNLLTVTHWEKDLVERWFHWFIQHWGLDNLKREPFLLPDHPDIPKKRLWEKDNFIALSRAVCKRLGLDNRKITYKIFKPDVPGPVPYGMPDLGTRYAIGYYKGPAPEWPHKFQVEIARDRLESHFDAVQVMAHELMHVRLLGGMELEEEHEEDHEIATDLGLLYRGLGLFHAETISADGLGGVYMPGYLNLGVVTYAITLILILSDRKPQDFKRYLNRTNYANIMQNFEALMSGEVETQLSKERIEESLKIHQEFATYFTRRAFTSAEWAEALLQEIEQWPSGHDPAGLANCLSDLGFFLTQTSRHEEAMPHFQNALEIDPGCFSAKSNMGYCHLHQGNLGLAREIFQESNPDNLGYESHWYHRAMGVLELQSKNPKKALEHFKRSHALCFQSMDIYSLLAEASAALGDHEAAKQYHQQQEWCDQHGGHNPIVEL